MNIKQAKEQIKNAITAYFTKDSLGNYVVPIEKQRPIFLMGPPGIGKTAIMEQIATELGIGMLSYSMTHHTRQSVLGLPFISEKNYLGKDYKVSEYTMSEIIASVYDIIEETGTKEGILFLDEINCVSETLSPIMLQFLQYKIFGRHRVPEGWIVVTAGNPLGYNDSARDFDIVTWDRLKRVDVEPNYAVWKEYAINRQVHPSILTYLDIKEKDFYLIETTVDGKSFVTARGWDDLSQMIKLYEMNDIKVDKNLIVQYVQNKKIASDFAVYYDLFNKYRNDYQVQTILEGKASDEIKNRAKSAKFDERISLLGLIFDALNGQVFESASTEDFLSELVGILREYKFSPDKSLEPIIQNTEKEIQSGKKSGNLSFETMQVKKRIIDFMQNKSMAVEEKSTKEEGFALIKKEYDKILADYKSNNKKIVDKINNSFKFLDEAFGLGNELVVFTTLLTASNNVANFISAYGSEEYFKHNKELLISVRKEELIRRIDGLNLW